MPRGRPPNTVLQMCSVAGCENSQLKLARGMCRKHYVYWYRHRECDETCAADGCTKPPYSAGYCATHRNRIARHGSPDVMLRPLRGRFINRLGYVRVYTPNHPAADLAGYVFEHRIVIEAAIGRLLYPGENVHHKNGDRADNRAENLELWISSQPAGQRVEDLVEWAWEILGRYG